jgi:hypothetical protein
VSVFAAFFCGAFVFVGLTAIAHTRQSAADHEPGWAIGFVDEGAVRSSMVEKLGASKPFSTATEEFAKERDEATDAECARQSDALLRTGTDQRAARGPKQASRSETDR